VDGSDAIATLVAVRSAVEEARSGGGPRAVEAVSLRLDGHAAHDDGRYMDQEQLSDYTAQRDPIERLASRLRLDGLSEAEIEALRAAAADEVSAGLAEAEASPAPDPATILDGVYATKLT
jgi:pyruvate dehydrogenase E1 component alpha subunit